MMDFAHARLLVRGQDQAATVSVSGGIDAQIRGTDYHSTRPSPGLQDPRGGVSEASPIVAFAHARSLARDEDQASTRILRRFDSPADIEAQIYGRGRQTAPSPGLDLWRRRPSGVEAKIHGTDYQSIRSSPGRMLGFDTTEKCENVAKALFDATSENCSVYGRTLPVRFLQTKLRLVLKPYFSFPLEPDGHKD